MESPKKLSIFKETELSYISRNGNPKKSSYISGSNFPYSKNEKKKNALKMFLMLQKMKLSSPKSSNISERSLQSLKIKSFLYDFSNISAKEKSFLYFSL